MANAAVKSEHSNTLPMGIAGDSGAERAANIIMLRLAAKIPTSKSDVVHIIDEQTAAPELLEALKRLQQLTGKYLSDIRGINADTKREVSRMVDATIAKATGAA